MELEELKSAWIQLDRRLQTVRAEAQATKSRSLLIRFTGLPILDLLGGLLSAMLIGSFLAEGHHEAKFIVPALILHLCAILTIVAAAWQLAAIHTLDYSGPVAKIQRTLALIRIVRIRVVQWSLLLSPLIWMPLFIVAAKGLLGMDLYRLLGTPYIAANILFGLAFVATALFIAKKFETRFANSRVLKAIADSIAGRSLCNAQAQFSQIAQFEQES